uniref:Uncharacterized protein n=1 Tax=Arundo donax TaxID=35708 RepID=A0A0A9AH81_ARUDO
MKFSNPETLKTPSPSISCVEKQASAISTQRKKDVRVDLGSAQRRRRPGGEG